MSRHRPPDEGVFRAALTRSGLSIVLRSRAFSALDRLFGALVGIAAARLEAEENRVRNQAYRESLVQDADAARITVAILDDDEENRVRNQAYRESLVQDAAAARITAAILDDDELPRSVADLALSSRVLPTSRKVRLSDFADDDPLFKPTTPKLLAVDVRGDDVAQN